nr:MULTISPECIES: lysylphosphatidylglycerol synthase transmembrane domain-containing protein [unclassified Sphingomonas]
MASDQSPARRRGGSWRTWFLVLLLLAALGGIVMRFGDIDNFLRLAEQARPAWLAVAILFQLSTYANVALGWRAVLVRAGTPRPLRSLLRIAIAKLFADQALPSAGMGGNVLLIDQLVAIGITRGNAMAALLISMIGFYAAYMVFALAALFLLWLHGKATPPLVGAVTAFLIVATAIPSLAIWLRHRGSRPLPPRIENIGFIRKLLETVSLAPARLLRDRHLLARVGLYNAGIFLADIATLAACLQAFGQPVAFATALIALILASVAVTLGPIPLGLGSFELVCTATLKLLGVPIEAALAGTLLLRMLTLWLPLVPGLVLMRRTLLHRSAAQSAPER